ncbi:hypothetical protein RBB50_007630 [Rhinocladiella similis]
MLDLAVLVWCTRTFYILSSAIILAVRLIPDLKTRFLSYGARDSGGTTTAAAVAAVHNHNHNHNHNATGSRLLQQKQRQEQQSSSPLSSQLLDHVTSWKVPHSWFIHFYILSVLLSTTCIWTTLQSTNHHFNSNSNTNFSFTATTTATPTTSLLCSLLMLLQGLRRLLECLYVTNNTNTKTDTKPSASRMWIGHYAIGLAFYLFTNLAIHLEYLAAVHSPNKHLGNSSPSSTRELPLPLPLPLVRALFTPKTIICTSLFLHCSYKQNKYHRYLAGLKKYTLPDKGAFQTIIAPHYTAECGIYLSLTLLQAPDQHGHGHGQGYINWSLTCALLFVMVNLGVTADGTREWMMTKFPKQRKEVAARWRMIPPFW